MHRFVVSIVGPDSGSAIADMRAVAGECDLIELRLDRIRDADLPRLLSGAPKPVIATCRPAHEGGGFTGTEDERLALLSQAVRYGAKYVDIELDSAAHFEPAGAKLIVSYHNFSGVPGDVAEIHARIRALKPAVAKLVCTAKGAQDNQVMLSLNRGSSVPTAAFCMGGVGLPSRVLARKYGACLTYASVGEGSSAGPGQPTIGLLRDTYRAHKVRSRTALYGLLGNPALHSVGPTFHNAVFGAMDKDAVYVPFETADADAFWSAFSSEVRGLSVTTPYKRKVIGFAKKVSREARAIGAVNTLVRTKGGFAGHNTDIAGVRDPLLARFASLEGKAVLVLGAGGAAGAAAYAARSAGANVTLANRTREKGETLAQRLGVAAVAWEGRAGVDCDIVINATSVGFRGEDDPLMPPGFFTPARSAFDLVYHRGGTAFLRAAAGAGACTIDGSEMFVAQAIGQLRLWTGKKPPARVLKRATELLCAHLAM